MKARFCDIPEGGKFKSFSRDFIKEGVSGVESNGRCFIFRGSDIVTVDDPKPIDEGIADYYGLSVFGGILAPSGEDEDEAIREYIDYQLRIK